MKSGAETPDLEFFHGKFSTFSSIPAPSMANFQNHGDKYYHWDLKKAKQDEYLRKVRAKVAILTLEANYDLV